MTAEDLVKRQVARQKAAAPFGIPAEAMAAYDLGAALEGAVRGEQSGFEAEVGTEVARHLQEGGARLSGGPHSVSIPPAGLFASLGVGVAGGGQELIFEGPGGTRGPLRPAPRVAQLNATIASGTGDLRMVRMRDGWELQWVPTDFFAEELDPDEFVTASDVAHVKTGMASAVFSRQLDAQSGVRSLLTADVDRAVAALVDQAALVGTGQDGQPLGLFNRDLALAPSLGVDGGSATYAFLCGVERTAHEDTLAPGWLTNRFVREQLRQVSEGDTGGPAWRGGPNPGSLLGAPAFTSGHVPSAFEKGAGTDLSGLVYSSDWTNLVIRMAGVEVVMDPFSLAARGLVVARVYLYAGVGLWHTEPFVLSKDIDAGSES